MCVCRPISESNIGSQMLRRMGWEEGKGLGRLAQGVREPVSGEGMWGEEREGRKEGEVCCVADV